MFRKTFLVIITFFAFTSLSSVVFAQAGNLNNNAVLEQERIRQEIRERLEMQEGSAQGKLEQKRLEMEQRIATKRAEIVNRLTERKRETIRNFFTRMTFKIEVALGRQERIANRIATRLEKMRLGGKDTAGLEEKLALARTKIIETRGKLELAKGELEGVLGSEDPKTAFTQVRILIKEIVNSVKEIHSLFVEIITLMKGMSPTTKLNNESSISVSTQTGTTSINIETNSSSSFQTIITTTP